MIKGVAPKRRRRKARTEVTVFREVVLVKHGLKPASGD
jgi:hypothetical protein